VGLKEQDIQTAIIKGLESRGAYVVKVIKASKSGVPDVLACLDGKFIALEVKTIKGKVSPIQEYHVQKVLCAGGICGIVRSVDEALRLIAE